MMNDILSFLSTDPIWIMVAAIFTLVSMFQVIPFLTRCFRNRIIFYEKGKYGRNILYPSLVKFSRTESLSMQLRLKWGENIDVKLIGKNGITWCYSLTSKINWVSEEPNNNYQKFSTTQCGISDIKMIFNQEDEITIEIYDQKTSKLIRRKIIQLIS